MMRTILLALAAGLLLTACAKTPGQNQYNFKEVGQSRIVEFATIVDAQPIDITGPNSGAGALVGAGIGAGGMSYVGQGSGNTAAVIGGALAGAVIGGLAEQAAADQQGIAYTLVTEKGRTKTVPQYLSKGDVIFKPGQRVMLQTAGSYQRVLPAEHLPTEIARPKGISVIDPEIPATAPARP